MLLRTLTYTKRWVFLDLILNVPANESDLWKMVLLASPSKPFDINMKGKPSRVKVLRAYDAEISQAYEEFGGASSIHGEVKKWIAATPWSEEHLTEFVNCVIEDGIQRKANLDDDIFTLGCDRYVLRAFHFTTI